MMASEVTFFPRESRSCGAAAGALAARCGWIMAAPGRAPFHPLSGWVPSGGLQGAGSRAAAFSQRWPKNQGLA